MLQRFFPHQRNSRIVNVLGRKTEMHPLFHRTHLQRLQFLLDIVLHRLYIMVGDALQILDLGRFFRRELLIDVAQGFILIDPQRKEFFRTQGNEILHFHQQAIADQRIFREIVIQMMQLAAVAAIQGRDCGQCTQIHIMGGIALYLRAKLQESHWIGK